MLAGFLFTFQHSTAASQDSSGADVKSPDVTLQVFAADKSFEHGESNGLVVVVTNASNLGLTDVTAAEISDAFEVTTLPPAVDLAAFETKAIRIEVEATSDASFGDMALPVEAQFRWEDLDGDQHVSSEIGSVDVRIKRKLEDEAGVVEGGASILYFFLPILLVLFAFSVAWSVLVKKQFPPPVPKSDLGALPFLVIIAALTYGVLERWDWLAYTGDLPSNSSLLKMIAFTIPAGIAIPVLVFTYRVCAGYWRFSGEESAEQVINKALTGPYRRTEFEWVKCDASGTTWEGILLEDGGNYFVLGASLQASPDPRDQERFQQRVLTNAGEILDRAELARMARDGHLTALGAEQRIKQNGVIVPRRFARKVRFRIDKCERTPRPLVRSPSE